LNIIIVDDERVIRQGLRRIIEISGIDHTIVGEASDGQEAYELLEKVQCDLLITDIFMPVMDGLELIAKIRQSNETMEIVILSGYGEFTYAQEALRLRVTDYILKPMNPQLVKGVLEAVLVKITSRKRSISLLSQCFNRCTAHVDKLVDSVWQLDVRQIEAALALIDLEVAELAFTEAEMDQLYMELISWVENKLESKSMSSVRKTDWMEIKTSAMESKRRFSFAIQCFTDEIRLSRNWGQRGPIRESVDYIQLHYTNPELSLQELLQLTGLSSTYFYELFKEETGQNFKSYLIRLRINKAMALLDTSEYKTYEVGEMVGYSDYPHFAKVFKKMVGLPPSEYKKRMGGQM
jgi:two-component system response regulator YesN